MVRKRAEFLPPPQIHKEKIMHPSTRILLPLVLAGLTACGARSPSGDSSERSYGSGTVVQGPQLRSAGGNLLMALTGRVSNFKVDRGTRCPRITFRGSRSLIDGGTPGVYVDRSRFGDTCILEQIQVRQVARVEVYPNGHTSRPGYQANPQGLILVFLTRSADGSRP